MEGLGSLTLIVKAPNQRIEDQRVACDRSWTVRQLKEHLSTVHPEKPHHDQQKLVYFGKLLRDEASLQEVLTQDSYDDAHTVHLVCPSQSHTDNSKPYVPRYSTHTTQVNDLRQRLGVATDDQPAMTSPVQPAVMSAEYIQQWNSQWMQALSSQQSGGMSAQQRLWLSMYQQQWAQYNTLLQQQVHNQQASGVHTPTESTTPGQREEAPAEPARPAAGADEVVRMNAQGGMDAEGGQNDWLDTLYAFVRFGMLLLLLYFYTTFGRFAIVIVVGIFFYLAQGNLLGNLLRLQRRRPGAEPAPQQPPQNEQNQAENQNNENNERDNIANDSEPGSEELNNNNTVTEENEGSWMDGVKLVLTFIVTFFTSLIPQNPAAVAN